ncbi:hypothetical protein ACFFX0_24150 [Citricoccus parietis]|uniref:Uncharacterized protein n=1 Tax=Citricoccus parietis TaxID=592307 RepID=A0ABV5G668_9MICC
MLPLDGGGTLVSLCSEHPTRRRGGDRLWPRSPPASPASRPPRTAGRSLRPTARPGTTTSSWTPTRPGSP